MDHRLQAKVTSRRYARGSGRRQDEMVRQRDGGETKTQARACSKDRIELTVVSIDPIHEAAISNPAEDSIGLWVGIPSNDSTGILQNKKNRSNESGKLGMEIGTTSTSLESATGNAEPVLGKIDEREIPDVMGRGLHSTLECGKNSVHQSI